MDAIMRKKPGRPGWADMPTPDEVAAYFGGGDNDAQLLLGGDDGGHFSWETAE